MADYNKLTVVQIRELFKSKNIPTTGLTRKAQLIERLLEEDAKEAEVPGETQPDQSVVDDAKPPGDGGIPFPDPVGPLSPSKPVAIDAQDDATMSLPPLAKPTVAEPVSDAQVAPQIGTASHDIGAGIVNAPLQTPIPTKEEPTNAPTAVQEQQPPSGSVSATASPAPEENRKRKRRSATPSVSEEEIAQKKAKQEEDGAAIILKEDLVAPSGSPGEMKDAAEIKDDSDWTMVEHPKEEQVASAEPSSPLPKSDGAQPDAESAERQAKVLPPSGGDDDGKTTKAMPGSPIVPTKLPPGREKRYKDLVSGRAELGLQTEMEGNTETADEREERDISPALHPATSALYIRDFMRPLRPDALEAHLVSLAHPPRKQGEGQEETSEGIIQSFHLDAIRTHCFAVFTSVTAAARVRSALHDRIWPAEGNRKPLWADFVPEDRVQGWIDTETNSGSGGRGAGQKRWEVWYERLDDGTMATRLQEASGAPLGPRRPTIQGSSAGPGPAASAPAPQVRTESGPSKTKAAPQPASFVALDSLFKSTSAKPKLYYMPVSKGLADRRLDQLEALTTRNNAIPPGGSGYADSRRYTFENDDMLVDNGPEFGLRQRGPAARGGYRRR